MIKSMLTVHLLVEYSQRFVKLNPSPVLTIIGWSLSLKHKQGTMSEKTRNLNHSNKQTANLQ